MKIILVIVICALRSTSLHLYAGAEQTYIISQSVSLKNIYACKDRCFALDKLFPFPMKYIRTVWGKLGTNHMYLEGHCSVLSESAGQQIWTPWQALKEAKLVGTPMEEQAWNNFNRDCESRQTEMSQEMRRILGLTHIHSEYVFYSDGKFENTQEGKQTNINDLFSSLLLQRV